MNHDCLCSLDKKIKIECCSAVTWKTSSLNLTLKNVKFKNFVSESNWLKNIEDQTSRHTQYNSTVGDDWLTVLMTLKLVKIPISKETFPKDVQLLTLRIRCTYYEISSAEQELLRNQSNLEVLTCQKCLRNPLVIHNITGGNTFNSELSSLRLLDLRYNYLVTLMKNSFSKVPNLKILRLDYNPLQFLPRNLFEPLNLRMLTLTHTRLANVVTIVAKPSTMVVIDRLCIHSKQLEALSQNGFTWKIPDVNCNTTSVLTNFKNHIKKINDTYVESLAKISKNSEYPPKVQILKQFLNFNLKRIENDLECEMKIFNSTRPGYRYLHKYNLKKNGSFPWTTIISEQGIVVFDVDHNKKYSICLSNDAKEVSPYNCKILKSSVKSEDTPWLKKSDQDMIIASVIIAFVIIFIISGVVMYFCIKKHPNIIKGNENVIVLEKPKIKQDLSDEEESTTSVGSFESAEGGYLAPNFPYNLNNPYLSVLDLPHYPIFLQNNQILRPRMQTTLERIEEGVYDEAPPLPPNHPVLSSL